MGQLQFHHSASQSGFGDVPGAGQNNVLGFLFFTTVGYHCELFFGKPFICDKLLLNPGQILQSITSSYMKK